MITVDSKSESPPIREEKKEGTIDDELSQLERGEEEKARRDHEAAMIVSEKEMKEVGSNGDIDGRGVGGVWFREV